MVESIRGWLDQVVVSRMFLRDPLSKEMTDWIRSEASYVCSMSWGRRQLTYGCHGL